MLQHMLCTLCQPVPLNIKYYYTAADTTMINGIDVFLYVFIMSTRVNIVMFLYYVVTVEKTNVPIIIVGKQLTYSIQS